MSEEAKRKQSLERIRENVVRSGHHIYVISGEGQTPRFAYTIGVSESVGAELILAGAVFYMQDDLVRIINDVVAQMKAQRDQEVFQVTGQGSFTLRRVDASWATETLLGAFDYYQKRDIAALQIVPDCAHWTIDVPDMSVPWSSTTEPAWRWLRERWTYQVPVNSTAATNLAALRGERINEVARWEENEWEIFAGPGPDVPKEEMRVVPLGVLLACDDSLLPALNLEVGAALWRDDVSDWHAWGTGGRGKSKP